MPTEKENETPKGLKYTVNDGNNGKPIIVETEEKEQVEGEEDAITITTSGTRSKNRSR